jgi:hypothetical protein
MAGTGAFLTLIGRSVNAQNCPLTDLASGKGNRLSWCGKPSFGALKTEEGVIEFVADRNGAEVDDV